jgi:hypothetical protein
MKDIIRRVRFTPYRKGMGPTFTLTMWDTGRMDTGAPAIQAAGRTGYGGKWLVGYRLTMRQGGRRTVLFQGEDFGCSPLHAIDSDAAVVGIMAFLTLRPGDTDREYFESYTTVQLDYCQEHA